MGGYVGWAVISGVVQAGLQVLFACCLAAALLLVAAGLAKLLWPQQASGLAGAVGLPRRYWFVWLVGVAEVVAGAGSIAVGGAWFALAVGALYLGFAVTVMRARRVGAASCGCFGRARTPPSRIHVAGNVVLAGVSFWCAAAGGASFLDLAADTPGVLGGITLGIEVMLLAGLLFTAFTALPEALSAWPSADTNDARHFEFTIDPNWRSPQVAPVDPMPVEIISKPLRREGAGGGATGSRFRWALGKRSRQKRRV